MICVSVPMYTLCCCHCAPPGAYLPLWPRTSWALYSESLSRTYRVATGGSNLCCERSFRGDTAPRSASSRSEAPLFEILLRLQADTAGRAASPSWGPGCFFSLPLDQQSSLPAFPFRFAVRVGAGCIWLEVLLWGAYSHIESWGPISA